MEMGATSYSADLSCWCSGSVVVLKKLIKKFFITSLFLLCLFFLKLDKNHTMVYLDADKQTYADLNVTGNVYGEQALCSLFLKAETKKGKSLMLDWIMHPLSDWEEICKRQEAIAWDFLPELPLNEEELDFIEYYLEYREQIRGANILLSCATIIDRLVRYDPNRYVVSRGVKLVFLMLHRLEKWTIAAGGNMPQLLKETADKVQELLHGSELEEVLQQTLDEKARLSNYTIDKYDYLFRCTRLLSIGSCCLLSTCLMFAGRRIG